MTTRKTKIFGAAMVALAMSTASEAATTMYAFDKVPDVQGVMVRDGKLNIVLGLSSTTKNGINTHNKVLPISPKGGSACKTMDIAEIGVFWTTKSCVKVKKIGVDRYLLDVVSDFKFKDMGPDDFELMKQEDFVKQRKMSIEFSYDGSSCSANVKTRTYVPVEGGKPVPSRTGVIGCAAAK